MAAAMMQIRRIGLPRLFVHVSVLVIVLLWLFPTLGLFVGYLMPSENVAQVTSLIVVFLSFLGGLFYPLSSMPDFMQTIAKFTPVYGIGELARSPLTGESFDAMWLINALVWLVVFVAGTTWAFRRDTKRV